MQEQKNINCFRLSPQQRRLWLLQQNSLVYQAQASIIIEGNLNTKLLQLALQDIIKRHEILRTSFHRQSGRKFPFQVVANSYTPLWRKLNLSEFTFKKQEEKIEELLQEERSYFFEFEQSSLLRLCLLTLSAQKYVLLVSLPAMKADTKTLKNLVEEISQSYAACLQGKNLSEEDEIVQYLQFSEWQNQLLEDEDGTAGKEYWNKQDFSSLVNLTLPFEEKPICVPARFEFNSFEWEIEPDVVTKIEALGQKYETSPSIFLLTCWQVLLWRLTGQQDIIVSTAFDGRQYEELERSLGLFAKYLPLTSHFDLQSKFSEILAQVNKSINDAYEWQDYFTGEETVERTGNCPDMPFYPLMFEYEEWSTECLAFNVCFSLYKHYVCFDRFKLKLACHRYSESLLAVFQYDKSCFLEENIKYLAEQFNTLLESVTNNPEVATLQLNILSKRELQQLLFFNSNVAPDCDLRGSASKARCQDKCIHKLFEEQAARTPNNIAVVFEEQQLTYRELNTRANKLAHYLQRLGVKPDVLVGIYVERSPEMVIGLLGILKAGGAYLPLDPALPTSGLSFRLQDAQTPVLLTQQQLVNKLPEHTARVVCLDSNWEANKSEVSENPTSEVRPENLVYTIYTSGSTGKPKGVLVEHQQLINYLHSIQEILNLPAGASFATVSTFAADLGNTVIFPSLCSGGCLHIVNSERASDPQALADYFHRHPIDCLKIVPSHLKALLTSEYSKQILPRQQLVLGGEATSWNLIEQIQQLAPKCQIFNHYGPTEATVGVTTFEVKKMLGSQESGIVPIGRPIANTRIYLLDSYLQPVPIGVPGELHIGGAALARGYLNQPELTAEKFINNPFSSGERLYKTGDLARYLRDGNIEFIERIDHQVKIHGFRIELGEIETSLMKHPAVSETVVIAREDEPGNKRLVAYVVPEHKSAPTTSALRQFLLDLLPEYMVPSVFVQMKALPLTPNGKVNRQMLPAPDTSRLELKEAYVAPRTSIEEILARIWAQVLKAEQVGIHDNFFELGGDSILSIQIVARTHEVGLHLTPKHLFEHQTIAELAAVASTSRAVIAEQGMVTGSLPLTPIQHWFFEQNLPEAHHWNQAVLLQVRQAINPVLLQKAVQQLIEHHDALRLRFVKAESSWQQIKTDFDKVVPFTRLDLSALSDIEQKAAIEAAATQLQSSLDLSQGRVVRVALFDLGATKPSRLLIIIHHLAVDGVSWRILLEDLQTAYQQISQGEAMQLPPKTTSFKYWAERLREYAQSEAAQQEQDYWLAQTRKSLPRLPVDYSGGANTVALERTVSVALSVEETQALLHEVPSAYRTQINDVLLTALVQAFAEWTKERFSYGDTTRSLLVELEGHGREEIFDDVNLSRTVGWFTTHFPVLMELGEASTPGEALKTIKEQLRGIPNRGIGYGVLRYLNGNGEQLQAQPQPEVKFNYLGQFDQVLSESSLFEPAQEFSGSERSLQGSRNRLLVVNGLIASGKLRLDWSYSEAVHQRSTIEGLAQSFVKALRSLITHCQSPEVGGYTPSDFPQMQFSPKELDELLTEL